MSGQLLKVFVNCDDVDEEMYAMIETITDDFYHVKYLNPLEKLYKGATVYELEDTIEQVEEEAVMEVFSEDVKLFLEVEGYYVLKEDIDDDLDSVIIDMSGDDTDSEDSFIAPEDGSWEPPPDQQQIDRDWNEWQPSTSGGKHFKETVDRIEQYARLHTDELKKSV